MKIPLKIKKLIDHFQFQRLPIEGTLYKKSYRSVREFNDGSPIGTSIIAMYCENPLSVSCFHRLTYDEIWHFYCGDPLILYLLYNDGRCEEVIMGNNPLMGHHLQYIVPANVWQAGCVLPGGKYSIFGCTMAPGFTGKCFEAANTELLIKKYPYCEKIIKKLNVNGHEIFMPDGFEK